MNEIERELNSKGYYTGNSSKFGNEYFPRWYAGSPGIPEPAGTFDEVYVDGEEIFIGNPFTQEISSRFSSVEEFLNSCEGKSGFGQPAWSQGMFDG